MKKIIYICLLLSVTLFSCQNDSQEDVDVTAGKSSKVKFTLTIPDYKVSKTKASYENNVNDVWLMVFDANGLFIERVQATNLVSQENNGMGSGTFEAQVPSNAGIIHFIGNYEDWDSFDDRNSVNKDERELIPSMVTSNLTFWGRSVITSLTTPVNVILYRNQAKITAENEAANFQLTGYAIANYNTEGTVAPFNSSATLTPFVLLEDLPTIPYETMSKSDQTTSDCTMDAKYMFENKNLFNDQTYVIIKGKLNGSATELYYKIQLLDTDKEPYPVVRNFQYKITIKSFSEAANGSTTFNAAKSAEPSNNIYAEINKLSPSISDDANNVLTVSGVNYLFVKGGALNINAHYTKNGTPADSEISVTVVQDDNRILSGVQYDGAGNITGNVATVYAGQQEATILVKAGILSRSITIISSELYQFDPAYFSPDVYTGIDNQMTLHFTIPNSIPGYLFPIKCVISTSYLYPDDPNKDLPIEYVNGVAKYVYWAYNAGGVTLNFKTSLNNSNETVTIENDIFKTASVAVKSRQFSNVSVNNTNLINYASNSSGSTGNAAVLKFTIDDSASSATYPLTVFVATKNLQTTDSGWQAVAGGYSRTYNSKPTGVQTVNFRSNKVYSAETISISANGFRTAALKVDNVLTSAYSISGAVRVYTNGRTYTIPNYTVTSSNTAIVNSFNTGSASTYRLSVKVGSVLSNVVTFTTGNYTAEYTVQQLLASPTLTLQ